MKTKGLALLLTIDSAGAILFIYSEGNKGHGKECAIAALIGMICFAAAAIVTLVINPQMKRIKKIYEEMDKKTKSTGSEQCEETVECVHQIGSTKFRCRKAKGHSGPHEYDGDNGKEFASNLSDVGITRKPYLPEP